MDQDCFDIDYEGSRVLADARINGNITTDKDFCLDGLVEGNIHCKRQVIINKGGVVDGDVECEVLFVNGIITGSVCVTRRAVLGASAEIKGGVITPCLEITPGAKIGKGLKLKKASK